MPAENRYPWQATLWLALLKLVVLTVHFPIRTDSVYVFVSDYLLLAKWMPVYGSISQLLGLVLGDAELAARVVVACAGALLLIPLAGLTRRLWGRSHTGWLFLLLLVHPWFLRWSIVPVNDMVFALLTLVSLERWVVGSRSASWFGVLALLTRPEGLVLVPLLLLGAIWHAGSRWVLVSGGAVFVFWMFLRPELIGMLGWEQSLIRAALFRESVEGLTFGLGHVLNQFFATGIVVAVGMFPVFLMSRYSWSRMKNTSLALLLVGLVLVLMAGSSATPQWNGRRALVPMLLLLPLIAGIAGRRKVTILWVVALSLGSTLMIRDGRSEYGPLRQAATYLLDSNWTGPVYTDDLRRTEWWLGRSCRPYKGGPFDPGARYILTSRNQSSGLPATGRRETFRGGWRLLTMDGSWREQLPDGVWETVSNRPPVPGYWGRYYEFEAAVY